MLYTPSINGQHGNHNMNPQGSQYAANHNHSVTNLVEKATNRIIFDAAPQQFFDLALLNMIGGSFGADSDEFFFHEMGYQREPVVVTATTASVTYPATVTVTVSSLDQITTNVLVGTPDNNRATIVEVISGANQIVLKPMDGESIEALSVDDELNIFGPIEADGVQEFAAHFRASTVEKFNYVQLFNRAIQYGEVELFKLQNRGATSNFLQMERRAMFRQFRIDISNVFWNGKRGQVVLKDGRVAKTTGGVNSTMIDAGSPVVSTPLASVDEAFEQLCLDTEYGEYGHTRFFFATPRMILKISKAYKSDKTRYNPSDMVARLNLNMITIGSTQVVLVPYARFEDAASFPQSFANSGFLLDMNNIKMRQMWNERMGETTDDRKHGQRKRYSETWVDANMGLEFNNPLACGKLTLT
jgi:hypothetical protein